MENQPEELPCEVESQPEELPSEVEILPKEFLDLWKNEEEEEEHREDFWEEDGDFWTDKEKEEFKRQQIRFNKLLLKEKSEEQDAGNHRKKKIERTAWKPSEMHVYYAIKDMLKNKQTEMRLEVHFEMLPIKEGDEEGVRAHNKLMAHFRHYFPDYYKFRCSSWEAFKDKHFPWLAGNSYIIFEDIARFLAMKYTNAEAGVPRFVYDGSSDSLQIYSVKVAGSPVQQKKKRKVAGSSTQWPLEVFGVVAVRDCVDPRRNLIFYRDRDNCQIITQEDPYLELTGPTRAVGMNHDVMIDAELKVKGAVEREDKYLIVDGMTLPPMFGLGSVELMTSSGEWKLDIAVGGLKTCVEATIFIKVVNGTWPIGFSGQIAARTKGIDDKIILIEFSGDDVTTSGDDVTSSCVDRNMEQSRHVRNMEQSRHVVSVQALGELMISFQAWKGEDVMKSEKIFKAKMSGRSFCCHTVSSCKLGVLVVWSRIQPRCGDMLHESEWARMFGDD